MTETSNPADFLISLNPSTEQELGRLAAMNRDDIDQSLIRAKEALTNWSRLSIGERQKFMARLAAVILEQKKSISELIAVEQGKPITEAMISEVFAVLGILKDLSRNAHKVLRPHKMRHEQILFAHKKSDYRLEPYGVVAIISPWNYPFSVPIPEIAAALVAGNTVVFKPAPATILIGQKIGELFKAAGFPAGVVNTLFLQDEDAAYLTSHTGINKLVFTGSTPVGRKVMCAASQQMTSVILELGGKDPAIVAADADLPRAARGIVWGALFNAGQVCASIERVYVERAVADRFIDLCLTEIKALQVGDPMDPNTQIGPLSKLEQLTKVENHIKDAVERGARMLFGGYRLKRPGYFMAPALLTAVDHSMAIMTEETFGPVLPIMVVDSIDQAVALANDSIYGLSAYAWTSSRKTAERLMSELQAGTVMINDSTSSWGEPNAPWGGFKMSGIGRTRARFGLQEMVQVKYASYDRGGNKSNPWWYPYNAKSETFVYSAAEALYSRRPVAKLINLFRVIFSRRFFSSAHWGSILLNLKKLF
jgi:acyl-CoA reductase-like NAD-dependent aldehyde dehydrogenase